MDFFEVVKKRKSVRKYKDEPINKEKITRLVDAARRAPSARAVEPWEFIAITKKETLKEIGALAENGKFIENAQAAIVIFCKQTKYYLEDGCAATENILLAAAAENLGACWIAGDKKDYADQIAKLLKVPADFKLISIISLGVPEQEEPQIKNRSTDDVIHWESF